MTGPSTRSAADRAELARVAGLIRAEFVRLARALLNNDSYGSEVMPTWDGGRDRNGRMRAAIWPSIASLVLRHGFDPVEYVQQNFRPRLHGGKVAVYPNMLLADSSVRFYQAVSKEAQTRLTHDVEAARQAIRTACMPLLMAGCSSDRALSAALQDPQLPMRNPVVCYLTAVASNLTDVAAAVQFEAAAEYLSKRSRYDLIFPAETRSVLQELVGRAA